MKYTTRAATALQGLVPALLACAACAPAADPDSEGASAAVPANPLVIRVDRLETNADGGNCILHVTASNQTGSTALNVQAAWMAQTEGYGIISDYQVLGDFAAAESRTARLGVYGAPCDAVRQVELTRAVCTVGPVQEPARSCADRVTLDGGGAVATR